MFQKILIANRGEIAVRVIRACRELGVKTVAVFSEVDRTALHVRWADEAYLLGPAPATESYLRRDKILEIAKKTKAEAIHPGYGFLAENAAFADACAQAGLKFIGPSGETMRRLGDKLEARATAEKVKIPVVPGTKGPVTSPEEASLAAGRFGYPVLLKARAGGGGKGMRRVEKPDEMGSAFRLASSEAGQSFGDPSLYLEKYIEEPHHVEVQILGDRFGNVIALGERECSVQRRHQKIIEETPSPFVTEATRSRLLEAAVVLGKEAGYENAGTMEFLVDKNQHFFFLETNARLQVEHPITEEVTGVDLVKAQLEIASGGKIPPCPPLQKGGWGDLHALECRIYAEDPDNDFLPSPGRICEVRHPEGPGVRVDSAVFSGSEISVSYDPMIAKLISWGASREEAIVRMERSLRELQIVGVKTNIAFLEAALSHPAFRKGRYDTAFVPTHMGELKRRVHEGFEEIAAVAAVIHQRQKKSRGEVTSPLSTGRSVSPWSLLGRKEGLRD